MSWKVGYWADLDGVQLNEKNEGWIHAARPNTYQHPVYGKLDFTFERLRRLADSVKNKVRGIDIDVDYDHKQDVAKGGKAAGWVRDADVRDDGLWLLVEWTSNAARAIKDKEYRYFSPEYTSEWTDAAGKKHEDVLFGGGITNRPFLKDLLPVNLSELTFETPRTSNNPSEGVDMDLKELAQLIGLSEDSDEASVKMKLAELITPKAPETPPAPVPVLQLTDTLKKLAEENPMVNQLVALYEQSAKENAANKVALREQGVAVKLNELDGQKIALTPTARKLIEKLGLGMPVELSDDFWSLMKLMHTSTAALIELGERGGAQVNRAPAGSATEQLNESIEQLVATGKVQNAAEAYDQIFRADPGLYDRYRNETFITGAR